ncbi:MAG: hypothetical protein DI533_09690 [Cereibacter sphaeroides]|uniref:Fibronectin type-III domain-containing protein n=1 Tax=Cereibacter sphaeroides TaxID=1063 RepID=A0A2W5TX85_CERSP|nr:MAG: hypothetical protein DI533_09690 [Cereibacter sphaeroides]
MVKQYFIPASTAITEVDAAAGVVVKPGLPGTYRAIAGVMAEGTLSVEETHVFALIGQSNMVGRSAYDGLGDYPAGTRQWTQARVLAAATSPLDHIDENAGDMGLSLQFAIEYLAANPGVKLVFAPLAEGGTSFSGGQWLPPSGYLYAGAISSLNALFAANPSFKLKGFLWHQGEGDNGASNVVLYPDRLDNLIDLLRANVMVAGPTTPFICGGFANGSGDRTPINNATLQTVERRPYTAFAPGADLALFDGTHFTAASLRTLGGRYRTAYAQALTNLPRAPSQVAGLTATAGDGQITLGWSKPLSHAAITDYVIEENAGGGWAVVPDGVGTGTSFVRSGLANGTTYSYRVSAISANGTGLPSVVVTATPTSAAQPVSVSIQAFASAVNGNSAASYTFANQTVAPGLVIAAIVSRGTSGNGSPSSVTLGGLAMTKIGEQVKKDLDGSAAEAFHKISFWRLDGVTGTTASLVASFASGMGRCGVALWSLKDAGVTSIAFAGEGDIATQTLSQTINVPARGALLAFGNHQGSAAVGGFTAGVDLPARLAQTTVSSNFTQTATDRLFEAPAIGHSVTMSYDLSTSLLMALVAVGPTA